jgi:hypothetical protein
MLRRVEREKEKRRENKKDNMDKEGKRKESIRGKRVKRLKQTAPPTPTAKAVMNRKKKHAVQGLIRDELAVSTHPLSKGLYVLVNWQEVTLTHADCPLTIPHPK